MARVILVEDDASLRRFVAMALEELPIELIACANVAEALAALQVGPADLVITDLMMPGDSGESLIERLAGDAALRGSARIVVFSAGLTPEVRTRLLALKVWRLLSKPVSLAQLEDCVTQVLAQKSLPTSGTAAPSAPAAPPPPRHHTPLADPSQAEAIEQHFGGDATLYHAFRSACLAQFAEDLREGDRACEHGDAPALRRLAHSLKSVLLTLGYADASGVARALEQQAAAAQPDLHTGWQHLRRLVTALID